MAPASMRAVSTKTCLVHQSQQTANHKQEAATLKLNIENNNQEPVTLCC